MPPLILQNCLPCELSLSFVDSMKIQQTFVLIKEETRNIFDFDLQEKIKLKFWINGYSKMQLVLDCEKELKDDD